MAKATVSMCYCTQCGIGFPILRTNKRVREAGHMKKLFCLNCNTVTNHVECRGFGKYAYEDFLIEFNGKNFTKEGNRKKPWRQFVAEYKQKEGDY